MHDINNLKALHDSGAAEARPKELEPSAGLSSIELKSAVAVHRPASSSFLHHVDEANDDTPHDSLSFSPKSHSSIQTSTHTDAFSPTSTHADVAANAISCSSGYDSCHIFDQESSNSSESSTDNLTSHVEAFSNTTSASPSHKSYQILDQESHSSSYPSLDLPDPELFWPIDDTTQMPLSHHKYPAPTILPSPNMDENAADDSTTSTTYDWADYPIDLPQLAPTISHGGSNSIPQDDLEKPALPNDDFMPSSSYPPSQGGASHAPHNNERLALKRMKKLDTLLDMLQTASLPNITEHNRIVREIRSCNHRREASGSLSTDLEEPTALSSAAKFAYDLLNWEKYRQEEKRFIREEDLSSISASKVVNARMMKARRRHSKSRDWASDGRKAAKMFFDALHNSDTVDRSFALLLLAMNVSLDQMLKIAHFPALRSSFASRFARVVENKAEGWRPMSNAGFALLNVAQTIRG